jgi:hypothetical protein
MCVHRQIAALAEAEGSIRAHVDVLLRYKHSGIATTLQLSTKQGWQARARGSQGSGKGGNDDEELY